MKKLFVLIVSGLMSLTVSAQQSALTGAWQRLDPNGNPTASVVVFMPDGKCLGQSFNDDFTVSSVWFMSNYKVLNDSSYVDQVFYHSNPFYQHDDYYTFHKENDSILVTQNVNYTLNVPGIIMLDRWKKMDSTLPVFTDAEWEALHQKSLAEFDRLPKEGQTVEQFAKELNDKAQEFLKANKLDRALELLHIRAELDTTNIDWQKELCLVYHSKRIAPSSAVQIANRYIRLAEAKAPAANDTSVVNAYRMKAYLYQYRGNPAMPQMRSIVSKMLDMEAVANQPTRDYGLDNFMMAMTYLPEGNMEKVYDCCMKSIDILEKATGVSDNQKAEVYATAGIALMMGEQREREAIDLLKKAESLFSGEVAFKITNMVYPSMFRAYYNMLQKNPKDKNLKKEVEQFMADKVVYEVFDTTNKEFNLWGEYIVLEKGAWTLENPADWANDSNHYVLQKGDEYRVVELKEGETLTGRADIRPTDAATKKDIIKQWKAYKKGKK